MSKGTDEKPPESAEGVASPSLSPITVATKVRSQGFMGSEASAKESPQTDEREKGAAKVSFKKGQPRSRLREWKGWHLHH